MPDADPPPPCGSSFDLRFAAMYDELRELAGRCLVRERDTLQPTALVHEAYLRCQSSLGGEDARHLRARLVTVMRHILVDHARRRAAAKRGGKSQPTLCDLGQIAARPLDLIEFEDALSALEKINTRMARIVELRVIGGFSINELAEALQVSVTTVNREWHFARAWLARSLAPDRRGAEEELEDDG